MFYKTGVGIKRGLSFSNCGRMSVLCVFVLILASCNKQSDCEPSPETIREPLSAEGRSFIDVFEKVGSQDLEFKNSNGQSQFFESSGIDSRWNFGNTFFECEENFVSQSYDFEGAFTNYSNDDFFVSISAQSRPISELSFISGNPNLDCIVEVFQISYQHQFGGFNELRIETEQNSCFSGVSVDNFEFLSSVKLNNVEYEKVYSNISPFAFVESDVKFYYSKEKGIFAFTDFDGVTWTLVE